MTEFHGLTRQAQPQSYRVAKVDSNKAPREFRCYVWFLMTDELTILEDAPRLLGTHSFDLQGQVLKDDDSMATVFGALE